MVAWLFLLPIGVLKWQTEFDWRISSCQELNFWIRNTSYIGRTAGAVTLADLAIKHPEEYDERVMRVFQSYLDFPPRYGENHEKEWQVDYTSIDTLTIVEAINRRKNKEKCNYRMRLTKDRPFRVTEKGEVERNPDYKDPAAQNK